MTRAFARMLLTGTLAVLAGTSASAQDLARGETPVRVDTSKAEQVLERVVTVRLDGVRLDQALEAIARAGRVTLTHSSSRMPADRNVTVNVERGTLREALRQALVGTGLEATVIAGQVLAVVQAGSRTRGSSAKAGAVAGRVTDASAGTGIATAEVFLDGTRWRGTTDSSGWYRLNDVDPGTYTLTARRLGYAKQSRQVTVIEGRTDTVDVALKPTAARLDELVTTATGRQRRLELGHDVTRLDVDSIMRSAPITSVTDLLENRVPGLTVQRTSGAPGDPARLRLRGAASPLRSNDPVVVVDGVRVYAEQSEARSGNLARAVGGDTIGFNRRSNYATPSPLDYIDPNSIETIEVIKGASASTLYGQDAANGVIVITTKKGKAGPTRWTMSAEHGRSRMAADYPELFLRWGHQPHINGLPTWCPISNVGGTGFERGMCVADSTRTFQILNDPELTVLGRGHRTAASLGASGGSAALTYSVTGSYAEEVGLPRLPEYELERYLTVHQRTPPDWMRRPQQLTQWGVSSRFMARLSSTAEVTLNAAFSRTNQQRSSLERQLGTLMSTYFDRASSTYYQVSSTNGTINPTTEQVLTGYYERATAAAAQFTNGVNLSWRPRRWLELNSDAGLNLTQRDDEILLPRGHVTGLNAGGQLDNGHGTSLVSTVNLRGVANVPLGAGWQFRLATGANYTGRRINDLAIQTRGLPVGTTALGDTVIDKRRVVQDMATFGWYVEPSVGHRRFWLNTGLRLDGGSNYGSRIKLPKFPKLNFSYLVSDEPFFPLKDLFQSFRLRVAYGRASRQPGIVDRQRLYRSATSQWSEGAFGEAAGLRSLGNTDLRPELTTELEGGFDADLLDSRLSLGVTGYRRTTDDALLSVPLPPSVYGDNMTILRNIGVVRNAGLELTVTTQLMRSAPITWGVELTVSRNRNLVVELGPGVRPFYESGANSGGSGVDAGGLRVAAGYPLYGRWARPILGYTDANDNGVLEGGEVLLGDTAVYVGSSMPNYEASLHTNVALWGGAVSLSAGLDYDDGLAQRNETSQALAPFSSPWNTPGSSLSDQAATFDLRAQTDYNWIQTVSTMRLQNLSVAYRLPNALARRVGAQSLSIAVQGSNLGLWTNYRGLDPNVNAFGTGNGVTDNGVLPQPRTWQVKINANY